MSDFVVGKIEQLTNEQFSPRGHMMPQTVEACQEVMAADAVLLEQAHADIGKLKLKLNQARQKPSVARMAQLEAFARELLQLPAEGYKGATNDCIRDAAVKHGILEKVDGGYRSTLPEPPQ